MIRRFGQDAAIEAAERADKLMAEGNMDGCATWKRIVKAIEELQSTTKPADAPVH